MLLFSIFVFIQETGGRSHKMIEKKRRDRINDCLSALTHIVPASFSRQVSYYKGFYINFVLDN